MKKRLLALLAALTLALALTACGGETNTEEPDEPPQQVQDGETEQMPSEPVDDAQTDDQETEGETDGQETEADEPETPEEPAQEQPAAETGMQLSRTDFTLSSAGSKYQLKATGAPDKCTFVSSDPKVATVAENGTVTAVAPGTAIITVTSCNWETQEKPAEKPAEKPEEKPADTSVDLKAFYDATIASHTFQTLQEFTGDVLETYYPGMGDIDTKQCLIMGTMMSMNNGEFCLVEVTNSADVDTVKSIFQSRIDYMAETGAWYPGPTELWTNSSRVVSNGNYVMMVVHEDCDTIVEEFNALF